MKFKINLNEIEGLLLEQGAGSVLKPLWYFLRVADGPGQQILGKVKSGGSWFRNLPNAPITRSINQLPSGTRARLQTLRDIIDGTADMNPEEIADLATLRAQLERAINGARTSAASDGGSVSLVFPVGKIGDNQYDDLILTVDPSGLANVVKSTPQSITQSSRTRRIADSNFNKTARKAADEEKALAKQAEDADIPRASREDELPRSLNQTKEDAIQASKESDAQRLLFDTDTALAKVSAGEAVVLSGDALLKATGRAARDRILKMLDDSDELRRLFPDAAEDGTKIVPVTIKGPSGKEALVLDADGIPLNFTVQKTGKKYTVLPQTTRAATRGAPISGIINTAVVGARQMDNSAQSVIKLWDSTFKRAAPVRSGRIAGTYDRARNFGNNLYDFSRESLSLFRSRMPSEFGDMFLVGGKIFAKSPGLATITSLLDGIGMLLTGSWLPRGIISTITTALRLLGVGKIGALGTGNVVALTRTASVLFVLLQAAKATAKFWSEWDGEARELKDVALNSDDYQEKIDYIMSLNRWARREVGKDIASAAQIKSAGRDGKKLNKLINKVYTAYIDEYYEDYGGKPVDWVESATSIPGSSSLGLLQLVSSADKAGALKTREELEATNPDLAAKMDAEAKSKDPEEVLNQAVGGMRKETERLGKKFNIPRKGSVEVDTTDDSTSKAQVGPDTSTETGPGDWLDEALSANNIIFKPTRPSARMKVKIKDLKNED